MVLSTPTCRGRRTVSKIRQFLLLGAQVSVRGHRKASTTPGETEVRAKCLLWEEAWAPGGPLGESRVDTGCIQRVLKGAGLRKGASAWGRGCPHRDGPRGRRPPRASRPCAGPTAARCLWAKGRCGGGSVSDRLCRDAVLICAEHLPCPGRCRRPWESHPDGRRLRDTRAPTRGRRKRRAPPGSLRFPGAAHRARVRDAGIRWGRLLSGVGGGADSAPPGDLGQEEPTET